MLRSFRSRVALCVLIIVAGTASVTQASSRARETIPVYIFAGQSNMVGSSTLAKDITHREAQDPHVIFFGPTDDRATKWSRLRAPTEVAQALYGPGFGPELSAASILSKHDEIGVVKFARNGTNLFHDWDPSRSDGLYRAMIIRTRLALASLAKRTELRPRLAGFFWMQGESDSYSLPHAQSYALNMMSFINHVRTDLHAPHLRIVFGRIAPNAGPFSDVVRYQQTVVASQARLVHLVETDDLAHDPRSPMHLSTEGELELGRRFARALGD